MSTLRAAQEPPHLPPSTADAATLAALQAELQEARAQADLLSKQLDETQDWLAATHSMLAQSRATQAEWREMLFRVEEDSKLRLAAYRAERARADRLQRKLNGEVVPDEDTRAERVDLSETAADGADGEHAAHPQTARPVRPRIARRHDVVTVIRPADTGPGINFRELWQYRHLFIALVRRNMRVEFDATRLGSIWGVVRPLLLGLVFVTFRNFSNADTREGLPYLVWVYTGLLFWTYFTDAATNAAVAVRNDAPLLTKVYYPRLLTPVVPIIAGLVILGIGMVPIIGMMFWYGIGPGWMIVLLPLVILQCIVLALGLGTIISSISIENRDWERLFIFGLTVALWLSPVIYAPEMIPAAFRNIYMLNPMVGLLLAFRAVLFEGFPVPVWEWAYSFGASVVLLIIGVWAFRRTEIRLMDRL